LVIAQALPVAYTRWGAGGAGITVNQLLFPHAPATPLSATEIAPKPEGNSPMPVQVQCPGCQTKYAFSEHLLGRNTRCKKCDHPLTISNAAEPVASGAAAIRAGTPPTKKPLATSTGNDAEGDRREKRLKKKRRREERGANTARTWLIGSGLVLLFLVFAGVTGVLAFWLSGYSVDKGPKLAGKWKGAPEIGGALHEATQGQMHPVGEEFAGAILQHVADDLLAVIIDFKEGGTVFFSGKTDTIGMPANSDGTWSVRQREGDIMFVSLKVSGAELEARLAFRDKNTFVLTFPDKKELAPVVFSRVKE
jgi:hypothetical protein